MLLSYLVRHCMPLRDALLLVSSKRPIAYPNKGFLTQLLEFESKERKTLSLPVEALSLHRYTGMENQKHSAALVAANKAYHELVVTPLVPSQDKKASSASWEMVTRTTLGDGGSICVPSSVSQCLRVGKFTFNHNLIDGRHMCC